MLFRSCLKFPKLETPITIFSGNQDERALPQEMLGWKNYTTNHFMTQEFRGGHFYFQGFEQDVAQRIIQNLADLNFISE